MTRYAALTCQVSRVADAISPGRGIMPAFRLAILPMSTELAGRDASVAQRVIPTGSVATTDITAELAALVRTVLQTRADPAAQPFLRQWPQPPCRRRQLHPKTFPVVQRLATLNTNGTDRHNLLVEFLITHARRFQWGQSYTVEDFGATFLRNYAFVELVGQRGALCSDSMACGLLVIGPDTDYPCHRHEAAEFYMPLTGPAMWFRQGEGWRQREAGEQFVHESWQPHALRTGSQPLVALYIWTGGNLTQKSLHDVVRNTRP